MTDKKISDLVTASPRSPFDGTEGLPTETGGANYGFLLRDMFSDGNASPDGFLNKTHAAIGNHAAIDTVTFAPSDPVHETIYADPCGLMITEHFTGGDATCLQIYSSSVGAGGFQGVDCQPVVNSDSTEVTLTYVIGGYFSPTNYSNADVSNYFTGLEGSPVQSGAGTIDKFSGLIVSPNQTAGAIANFRGVWINPAKSGGTTTNLWGLAVEDCSGMGSSISENIRSKGASSLNKFEGTIDVGVRYKFSGTNILFAIPASGNWAAFDGSLYASITTGNTNLALGEGSLSVVTSGLKNVGLGQSTLLINTSGSRNLAIGYQALSGCTDGTDNVGVGASAMLGGHGAQNLGIGTQALQNCTDGNANTAIGYAAGAGIVTSTGNTCIGWLTMNAGTSEYNVCIGYLTGLGLTTGKWNTLIGADPSFSGGNPSSGNQNISIGYECYIPTPTNNGQLVIGNYIYGTGLTGTLTTISGGKIGIGVKVPVCELDVAGTVKTLSYTVAGLPAAGNAGARALVTDATVTTFATVVAGTGGNNVPVYDDGTNWRIG